MKGLFILILSLFTFASATLTPPGTSASQFNLGNANSYPVSGALLTGLAAYWNMNQSGTRTDALGNNNLTAYNSPAAVAGKVGQAVQFQASSSTYLGTPQNGIDTSGDYSWAGWVRPSAAGNALSVVHSVGTSVGSGFSTILVFDNDNSLILYASDNGTTGGGHFATVSTAVLSNDTWYFVAYGYKSANNTIWISTNNGTPATNSFTGPFYNGGYEVLFGALSGGTTNKSNATVDEVGIWHRFLDSSDLAVLYNSGSGTTYPFGGYNSVAVNLNQATGFLLNLNASVQFSFTGGTQGQLYNFFVTQSGGSNTIQFAAGVKFNGGVSPTVDDADTVVTRFWAYFDGTNYIVGQ